MFDAQPVTEERTVIREARDAGQWKLATPRNAGDDKAISANVKTDEWPRAVVRKPVALANANSTREDQKRRHL